MGKIKIVSRPDPMILPDLKLPFHVRSAGENSADMSWREYVSGERKPFVQIFWTVGGTGKVEIDGREYTVGAGDFFHHLPGEEHKHRVAGKSWHYCWFTFDGAFAASFMGSYGYGRAPRYAGECPVGLFLEIELLLRERTPFAQRHAVSVAAEILALAGGKISDTSGHSIVRRFIELARETFADGGTSAASLAADLRIHRTTLTRLFEKEMSISPGRYLQGLRLQRALSLLRETEIPVKAVAAECGLPHTGYFCRMIRKATGLTPAGYRRQASLD